jgi:small-conductance mechanosensitive channel
MKNYTQIIPILISVFTILSLVMYPTIAPSLATGILLFSLAIGLHAIFQKHKKSNNPRLKIGKDTLILVFTIVLISFLSGIAGLLTNHYVSISFGAVIGLICTILIGFVIGYLVRKGITKLN